MIERIRQFLYDRALNRYKSTNLDSIPAGHFDNIRTVGIIFEASDPETRETVLNFRNDLFHRDKEVQLLGFFDTKAQEAPMPFNYFTLGHLSFAKVPKSDVVRQFIARTFDVLINLDHHGYPPLEYVAAASRAHFKIGSASGKHNHYDLMIDMQSFELPAFIEEIKKTFNQIN